MYLLNRYDCMDDGRYHAMNTWTIPVYFVNVRLLIPSRYASNGTMNADLNIADRFDSNGCMLY